MEKKGDSTKLNEIIISSKNFLIIQDLDGVCIPLVKDPLKRKLSKEYIYSVNKLKGKFSVLTCGEHGGRRGVNKLVEIALGSRTNPPKKGFYLPGLAACGVELQDRYGNITYPGLNKKEIDFLAKIPAKMRLLLSKELGIITPELTEEKKEKLIDVAVCDTRFTPTINLNELLMIYKNDINKLISLQKMMQNIMNSLINDSIRNGLGNSFHLHIMPNLGFNSKGEEIIKYATKSDFGSTDIQFIIKGAMKEAGVLVLLNEYLRSRNGRAPFGIDFNIKNSPESIDEIVKLCIKKISPEKMPLLIGVGDTVTSSKDPSTGNCLRGGSDRNFLTLIQELGKAYKKPNQIIFVNSSNKEVLRPKIKGKDMNGISDSKDLLKFNKVMENGPEEYINWFNLIAKNEEIKMK